MRVGGVQQQDDTERRQLLEHVDDAVEVSRVPGELVLDATPDLEHEPRRVDSCVVVRLGGHVELQRGAQIVHRRLRGVDGVLDRLAGPA